MLNLAIAQGSTDQCDGAPAPRPPVPKQGAQKPQAAKKAAKQQPPAPVVSPSPVPEPLVKFEAGAQFIYLLDNRPMERIPPQIRQYRINDDGTLRALATPSAKTGHWPYYITTDQSARYVYVTSYDNPGNSAIMSERADDYRIWQYRINGDGTLTSLNPPSVKAAVMGNSPFTLQFAPDNRVAYCLAPNDDKGLLLLRFRVGSNGALSSLPALKLKDCDSASLHFCPGNNLLYISSYYKRPPEPLTPADPDSHLDAGSVAKPAAKKPEAVAARSPLLQVDVYRPEAGDSLRKLGRIQVAVEWEVSLSNMLTFEPKGRYAYIPQVHGDAMLRFRVEPDGTLIKAGTDPVPNGWGETRTLFEHAGRYAYIFYQTRSFEWRLSQYTAGREGELSPLTPRDVSIEGEIKSFNISPGGRFLFITTEGPQDRRGIRQGYAVPYRVGEDGSLQRVGYAPIEAGPYPGEPHFDATGRFIYFNPFTPKDTYNLPGLTIEPPREPTAPGEMPPLFAAEPGRGIYEKTIVVQPGHGGR